MSVNSSSSSDGLIVSCWDSRTAMLIFTAFTVSNISLIPLFFCVVYVGVQRWRKRRSASAATSHSDVFTYNVIVLETISLLGCCLYFSGGLINVWVVVRVGLGLFSFTSSGQSVFHVLTCVERYLAVVHPVTYMSLRRSGGVRIRNVSIGCVWLLCFAEVGKNETLSPSAVIVVQSCILLLCLGVVSVCSVSILWTLVRPGPGDRCRERVDQSKQRAFHTVTAIMGVLCLRFVGILVADGITCASFKPGMCEVTSIMTWSTLPGSLVLPLLFLHRAGKLPGCKGRLEIGSCQVWKRITGR